MVDPVHLVRELLSNTRLTAERIAEAPGSVPTHLVDPFPVTASPIALPPPQSGSLGLGAVLATRSAQREYRQQGVVLADVGSCLFAAAEGDRRNWREESEAGVDLDQLVLVRSVDGLAQGFYVYEPVGHTLRPMAPFSGSDIPESIVLQAEFGRAPVVFVMVGNLAAAVARHDGHGYRQLLLRAGAAVHNAWLTAIRLGMCGCPFAGLLAPALQQQVGTNGYTRAALFALALGYPLAPSSE